MHLKKIAALSLITVSLTGCALLTPYTPPIEQGKVISAKMVDQLKPGMTESQVSYILGSPDIQDPFHRSAWNYIYTFQRTSFSPREEKKLIIEFKDNKLVQISGDYPPPHVIYDTSPPKPTQPDNDASLISPPATANKDIKTTTTSAGEEKTSKNNLPTSQPLKTTDGTIEKQTPADSKKHPHIGLQKSGAGTNSNAKTLGTPAAPFPQSPNTTH